MSTWLSYISQNPLLCMVLGESWPKATFAPDFEGRSKAGPLLSEGLQGQMQGESMCSEVQEGSSLSLVSPVPCPAAQGLQVIHQTSRVGSYAMATAFLRLSPGLVTSFVDSSVKGKFRTPCTKSRKDVPLKVLQNIMVFLASMVFLLIGHDGFKKCYLISF